MTTLIKGMQWKAHHSTWKNLGNTSRVDQVLWNIYVVHSSTFIFHCCTAQTESQHFEMSKSHFPGLGHHTLHLWKFQGKWCIFHWIPVVHWEDMVIWSWVFFFCKNVMWPSCLKRIVSVFRVIASGNWGQSAQPLYNITFFPMCIHLHHSDTHSDQVSYFMGEFRPTVILISLAFVCMVNSARLLIFIMQDHHNTYWCIWSKTQFLLDVIKCVYDYISW